MNAQQQAWLDGLMDVHRFYKEHPELIPLSGSGNGRHCSSKSQFIEYAAMLGNATGEVVDNFFVLTRTFKGEHRVCVQAYTKDLEMTSYADTVPAQV